jgi:hypothetical protein
MLMETRLGTSTENFTGTVACLRMWIMEARHGTSTENCTGTAIYLQ